MKKLLKSKLFFFILGALIFGTISAAFAYDYIASNVGYTSLDSQFVVDDVAEALDSIYIPLKKYGTVSTMFQVAAWDTSGSNHRGFFPVPSRFKSYKITGIDNINSQYCTLYAHKAPNNAQVSINLNTEYLVSEYPNVYVDMKPSSTAYTTCTVHITLYSISPN